MGGERVDAARRGLSAGGLVLAGGRGSRLGGRDKASLTRPDGRRLVDQAVAALAPVCARGVTVLRGPLQDLQGLDAHQVADPGLGPVGALGVGIEAAITGGQHTVLVLAVDIVEPCVPLLQRMGRTLMDDDHDVVLPIVDGRLQPLHAAWSTRAASVLAEAVNERVLRLHDVLDRLDVRVVERDDWIDLDPAARFALDVDVPADLALLAPQG